MDPVSGGGAAATVRHAGAPSAVTFASGQIEMKDMIKVALLADGILSLTVALVHLLFAPIF